MKVRYIYSACIEIESNGFVLLCDPWFTPGAYDGSWYHFPKMDDPLEVIREPDAIYISHIHPDHYDPEFLHTLFKKFGPKPVIIGDFEANFLARKMKADGIEPSIGHRHRLGPLEAWIIPNENGGADIDSALLVRSESGVVLNLNDCIWDDDHVALIDGIMREQNLHLDLLAVGYTGAGPYPQTYYDHDADSSVLAAKAAEKKQAMFERYRRFTQKFPARLNLPFAGQYVLGGSLAGLNPYRGVADAVEVLAFDPKARVPEEGGAIDVREATVDALRTQPFPEADLAARLDEIAQEPMDYETDLRVEFTKVPYERLLRAAHRRALQRTSVQTDCWFQVDVLVDGATRSSFSFSCTGPEFQRGAPPASVQQTRIQVDHRYLFGLLTGMYHWNNASVGSQYASRRKPDVFIRSAQDFLNFLACV